ncbi:hypothetical protein STCU_07413 [Strigomonas culicis]|uniref:Uncharacterized protein n=1 Tax=Strigomonas culicis TaxID=28005 RepID=S9VKY9_9TRYP|nr:hypothetical protein STCU_07413 [Strigomonas culicis]|eukprot:EPY23865.1 hypothetical protein STCU_07413 [Strigomonas culicis]
MTADALIFTWFSVFTNLELLLRSCVERDPGQAEDAAIRKVSETLHRTIVEPCLSGRMATQLAAEASFEEVIEVVYLLSHPFTRRSYSFCLTDAQVARLDRETALLMGVAHDHASLRCREPASSESVLSEKLDPEHTLALVEAASRLRRLDGEAGGLYYYCCLLTKECAQYVAAELDAVVRPKGVEKGPFLRSLQLEPQVGRVAAPLDRCDAPTGIRDAPTKPDDVWCLTRCGHALVKAAAHGALTRSEEAMRLKACDAIVRTLSLSPNYDLTPRDVVRCCVAFLDSRTTPFGEESTGETSLRLLLILSRLTLDTVDDRAALCQLFTCLCRLNPPVPSEREVERQHEWRRLRGLVMRQLFDTLTVAELNELNKEQLKSDESMWQVLLTNGTYDGVVPLDFWYECCGFYFPALTEGPAPCSPATAASLVYLRARMQQESIKRRMPLPLNEKSISYVADCLVAMSHGRLAKADLIASPDAWPIAVAELDLENAVLQPLLSDITSYLLRQQRHTAAIKIIKF